MTIPRTSVPALFLLLAGAWRPALAQPAPKATEPPREEAFVTEKGFSSRVFEVRYREPGDLAAVVRPLGSGFKGAAVSFNRDFKTVTVRDFPENVAAIEAALKRLDVAEAPRSDVELRLWVLVASRGAAAGAQLPADLAEAVGALKSTLTYKNYTLAGTFVQRVRDGARGIHGEGVTDITPAADGKSARQMQLEYQINGLSVEPEEKGPATIKLDGFHLVLVGGGRSSLRTDVTLREGEKVVVGTSTVRDQGLVVVVSGRVIR
jgi:hypothetical protein